MQILKEHITNLIEAFSAFNDNYNIVYQKVEAIAHHNFKTSNPEEDEYYCFIADSLHLLESGIDNNGQTQHLFSKAFDKNIYYVSCVKDFEHNCDDKIIFQLTSDDD